MIEPHVIGDQADLVCNECGAIIATVPAVEGDQTLLRMAMADGITSEACPSCGKANVFPGLAAIDAFFCRHCGAGVAVKRATQ